VLFAVLWPSVVQAVAASVPQAVCPFPRSLLIRGKHPRAPRFGVAPPSRLRGDVFDLNSLGVAFSNSKGPPKGDGFWRAVSVGVSATADWSIRAVSAFPPYRRGSPSGGIRVYLRPISVRRIRCRSAAERRASPTGGNSLGYPCRIRVHLR